MLHAKTREESGRTNWSNNWCIEAVKSPIQKE